MYESSARYPMPAGIVNGYSAPVTPAPNGLPSTNAFASAYHDAASAYNDKAYDPAPGPAQQTASQTRTSCHSRPPRSQAASPAGGAALRRQKAMDC